MNRRHFLTLGIGAASASALAAYPFCIERNIVQINRYKIPIKRLPEAFNGFTIVHLTDLHFGLLVSKTFIQTVINRANEIPRDIIVCTGDYVHEKNSTNQIDIVWPLLMQLRAPGGVYSVLGNHDHWACASRSLYWLHRSGHDIRFQAKSITKKGSRIWMVGAGDLWEDNADINSLMKGIPEHECRIILAHNPDSADASVTRPFDLMITGHTHGGQVNIPFVGTPVLPVQNKNYSSGLKNSLSGMPVFISKGIGWAVLPVRFNSYPEIAVLELYRG
jgi:predicted MPP superfamily phosphohydrolase